VQLTKETAMVNSTCRHQLGLSVIEFLVGLAVGLFVVGGAAKLFVDYIGSNRNLLLETRVNQDLRAAADLIARDLRRASYWAAATDGMVAPGAASAPLNPFRTVTVSNQDLTNTTNGEVVFAYDKAASASETSGFRVRNGALQLQLGSGNWQAVTDTGSLFISVAQLATPVLRTVDLYMSCPCVGKLACTPASFHGPTTTPSASSPGANYANRPRLTVRQYTLTLRGYAPNAPTMVREVRETIRVRNDDAEGVCPGA
jgi:prepilin peptidase dependent protein B